MMSRFLLANRFSFFGAFPPDLLFDAVKLCDAQKRFDKLPGLPPYPAHEATSSALNLPLKEITGTEGTDEVSTGQQQALYPDPNFGRVNIDWRGRAVTLHIRSVDGQVVQQTTVPFSELKAQ